MKSRKNSVLNKETQNLTPKPFFDRTVSVINIENIEDQNLTQTIFKCKELRFIGKTTH